MSKKVVPLPLPSPSSPKAVEEEDEEDVLEIPFVDLSSDDEEDVEEVLSADARENAILCKSVEALTEALQNVQDYHAMKIAELLADNERLRRKLDGMNKK